ncbi:DUF4296 domain-containing protein [Mucilaginibacter sp. FT3.2]|uniref:DUF4296 domain-containing protein n=1 Tax=Mucilaginibacter sp. FT3.2 TaxID=2723090 RepID=UPI001608970A|nr:DUF4296 domain-containing protein [Mucilaginibacter sp. FT3.2]MBB6229890.1 hypothetical protein [Mucilaginibacter sp. FT3.2]
MYKYLTLFFSVTLFCCGCKSNSVPNKFIQPNAMTGLLVQIHLIDGSLYNNVQVQDTLYKYGMGKYLAAFKRFNTDSAQFRKSLVYYSNDPDKLSAIYDKVDLRIKAMSDSVNQVQAKERTATHKADSLRLDSIKKANMKPKTAAQKADSVKQLKVKQAINLKRDSVKKLNHRLKPNAVPIK